MAGADRVQLTGQHFPYYDNVLVATYFCWLAQYSDLYEDLGKSGRPAKIQVLSNLACVCLYSYFCVGSFKTRVYKRNRLFIPDYSLLALRGSGIWHCSNLLLQAQLHNEQCRKRNLPLVHFVDGNFCHHSLSNRPRFQPTQLLWRGYSILGSTTNRTFERI